MTTGPAAGAGVFTFGSTTSAWCSGSFSSSGSTVFMGAGAMATGTGAGVATGAAVGGLFWPKQRGGGNGCNNDGGNRQQSTGGSDVFFCMAAGAGSGGAGVHVHRLWRIQFIVGDTDGSHRRDKRRVGLLKGHHRGRFLAPVQVQASLITTGSGSGTNDPRRQSSTSSRAFSLRLTKPQKQITGLPSTRKTKFSPGN